MTAVRENAKPQDSDRFAAQYTCILCDDDDDNVLYTYVALFNIIM
jgi:hypothetical protein